MCVKTNELSYEQVKTKGQFLMASLLNVLKYFITSFEVYYPVT